MSQAQSQYDKGTPPQLVAGVSSVGSYISTELGNVNLSNGGLNFNIPLGTVGGRGNLTMPLTLSYSSKDNVRFKIGYLLGKDTGSRNPRDGAHCTPLLDHCQ